MHKKATVVSILCAVILPLSLVSCTNNGSDEEDSSSVSSPAADANSYPVTISTSSGELTMEEPPVNPVALVSPLADMLAELGADPVMVGSEDVPSYYKERFESVVNPAIYEGPYKVDSEGLIEYNPDLIVGAAYSFDDANLERAKEIAPTFNGVDTGVVGWEDTIKALSILVTGSEQKALEIISGVKEEFSEVREKTSVKEGQTYSFLQMTPDGNLSYGNGSVLEYFGLTPAASQDNLNQSSISMENIRDIDSDFIFILDRDGNLESELMQNDSYASLSAVESGKAFYLDNEMASAINGASPSSLTYIKEQLAPVL